MVDRTDINHLLALSKSFTSFKHALKLLTRHASDRLSHPRGTRLVMGNALVGRLLYSLSLRSNVTPAMGEVTNSEAIGLVLYDKYLILFSSPGWCCWWRWSGQSC